MPADALAPRVARALAGMVLAVKERLKTTCIYVPELQLVRFFLQACLRSSIQCSSSMQQKGKSLAKHRWQLAYNWQPWIITVTWTDPRLWYNTHAEDPPLEDLCGMASVGPRPPSSGLQCQ